jgi:hypothetical protein
VSADKAGYDKLEELIAELADIIEEMGRNPLRVIKGTFSAGWEYKIPVTSSQAAYFEVRVTGTEVLLHLRAGASGRYLRTWHVPYEEIETPDL